MVHDLLGVKQGKRLDHSNKPSGKVQRQTVYSHEPKCNEVSRSR